MSVRLHMIELGPPMDEATLAWEIPWDILSVRDTPLLAGVDPFGYTMFIRPQIDYQLPREITSLRVKVTPDLHPVWDELERLIAVAKQRPHRYVWFEGD
jgi:hypothetical protein